jgi:GTP pyrophosphokinase
MEPGNCEDPAGGDARSDAKNGTRSDCEAADSTFPLVRSIANYLLPAEREQVERALHIAREAHQALKSGSRGAHGFAVALAVATHLAETGHAGPATLVAALLYAPVAAGSLSAEAVRAHLGDDLGREVIALIEAMRASVAAEQLAQAQSLSRPDADVSAGRARGGDEQAQGNRKHERKRRRARNAEILREMLLIARQDPRIAAWALAVRLQVMGAVRDAAEAHRAREAGATARQLEKSSVASQQDWTHDECIAVAHETRDAFVPVASHLGMRRLEAKLQDHTFAVLQPEEYRRLGDALAAQTHGWQPYLDGVCATLRDALRDIGIQVDISYRVKALYSAHQKLKRLDSDDPADLFDLLAVRIITENLEDCYFALDLVHDLWPPIEGRVKDYIAAPKKNGYRSLHTTVYSVDDRMVEIQIRTRQMHVVAEYGMHWRYKNYGDAAVPSLEESTELAETVLRHQERIRQAYQTPPETPAEAPTPQEPEHDHLHLFTRDGLLKTLPRGATALDFAYYVHTEVGNHAVGAQVIAAGGAKRAIALDEELQGGETIEILLRDDAHPTYEWLARANTKKARAEITRYLRTHRRERDLERLGRERVEGELRALGLGTRIEDVPADDLSWLVRQLNQPDTTALLVAVGSDKIELASVQALLRTRLKLRTATAPDQRGEQAEVQPATLTGLRGILTRPANCCHPLPGDDLVGYVSRGSGIVIHRAECSNVPNLRTRFPERIVAVEWPSGEQDRGLRVHVTVEGGERIALLRDIMGILDRHGVSTVRVDLAERASRQQVVVDLVLEIVQLDQLHSVLRDLRAVPGVLFAERSGVGGRPVGATRSAPKRPAHRDG